MPGKCIGKVLSGKGVARGVWGREKYEEQVDEDNGVSEALTGQGMGEGRDNYSLSVMNVNKRDDYANMAGRWRVYKYSFALVVVLPHTSTVTVLEIFNDGRNLTFVNFNP